jgi:hypothetical protein
MISLIPTLLPEGEGLFFPLPSGEGLRVREKWARWIASIMYAIVNRAKNSRRT